MGVTILMYHAVHPARSVISTPPELFRQQMARLAEYGPPVVPLAQVVARLNTDAGLPDPAVVLTFDDGFQGLYETAFPILKRNQLPATIFLVTDYCGQTNAWPGQPPHIPTLPLLGWEQIEEMARHGIDFGAHTATHPQLNTLPPDDQRQEILSSKETIAARLGSAPPHFAYPYGAYSPDTLAIIRTAFEGACSTRIGQVSAASNRFALERVDAFYLQYAGLFGALARPWFPLYLAALRTLKAVRRATRQQAVPA